MKRFPCRCKKCGARKTFNFHPDSYQKPKKCSCGGEYRVDWYRKKKENKKAKCLCDGYHFPHRKGSKWCRYYKGELSDDDYRYRY
ncbi:MAG: hypothetical protein NT098_01460 [Candidatus Parcubacteria bacterium]|nr:hypothetical protein [Candidatus Parcubacteria bacterium]